MSLWIWQKIEGGVFPPYPVRNRLTDYIQAGLINLNISGIQHPKCLIFALEEENTTYALKTLIMDTTDHSPQALKVLFESLKYPHLTYLSLRNCNITSNILPSTLERIGLSALHHLDLSFNPLEGEGINQLLSLGIHHQLEKLDLSGCPCLTSDLSEGYPFIVSNSAPSEIPQEFPQMNL